MMVSHSFTFWNYIAPAGNWDMLDLRRMGSEARFHSFSGTRLLLEWKSLAATSQNTMSR